MTARLIQDGSHRPRWEGNLSHLVSCPETTALLQVIRRARKLGRMDIVNEAENALQLYCTEPE